MWANMDGAVRTNYTLKFRAASSNYAGFQFDSQANTSNYAGFFLHYGGSSDSSIYTADGITLVADRGWLTLAQRTTSSKGVRIMAGTTTPTTRINIPTSGQTGFLSNPVNINTLNSNAGFTLSTNGTGTPSTIGYTAAYNEGIFWHTTSGYGIYRTSGAWSSNTYQQLRLQWNTGIYIDGGTAYANSGVSIIGNNNFEFDELP